ncbi:MAG: molecular chaperone HtpG [Immundisolibacterales bacterium]|nr:molecular chaperone HtpG [Immundisolibacterales bacterium]
MSAESGRETRRYEAEVGQLLDLMIRSLYSNKEIFLRELVSNGSDAADRLRFAALSDDSLYAGDGDLRISIRFDSQARTVTVTDNGIGMSRDEVIENIGTIARSGTRRFMESLTGDEAKDAELIGQFGVGFYSVFIVAERVVLTTRKAGAPVGEGVRWESDGRGEFTIETVEAPARGTEVVLHLREGEDELLDGFRLRGIVRKYSDHISFPIRMAKEDGDDAQGAGEASDGEAPSEARDRPEEETVNRATALWGRPRQEIEAEEYEEFYKHIAHDFEAPLDTIHARIEGNVEYTVLLFIPARASFDLWDRNVRRGLRLYVRRVFILEDAGDLLPAYLRFVRGVIDSSDLPLNVSREILQTNRQVEAIRSGAVKRVLGALDRLASGDEEKYAKFWNEFGKVLKEGVIEDAANRETVAGLLRFHSTAAEGDDASVSLAAYVERMKTGQEAIHFLTSDSLTAARSSPHLEVFRKRGVEVLLLTDPVDEWLVGHLTEFDGKPLRSVSRGDLDLASLGEDEGTKEGDDAARTTDTGKGEDGKESGEEEGREASADGDREALVKRIGEALGDRVKEARVSRRLTISPACLVADEHALGTHFENVLRAAGHDVERSKPILEVNADHPIVDRMSAQEGERFVDWAQILHDQALLSEGGQLEDPAGFVRRLNDMFQALAGESVAEEEGGGGGPPSAANE